MVHPAQPLDTGHRDGDRLGASVRGPAQVTDSEIQGRANVQISGRELDQSSKNKGRKRNSVHVYTHMFTYIHICVCMYIHIYIYVLKQKR